MLRNISSHYRVAISLPSLSSREAARAKLARDVEEFLARGGKINQVDIAASGQIINPVRNTSIATVRPPKAVRASVWNHEKRRILRERYYTNDKAELAEVLGVTVDHLNNEALRLGLTSRSRKGNEQ